MTSKNTENQNQATNGLDDIMQDVANQLSNDLYDIPQNTAMDKALDNIDKKLTDSPEDLNLNDDDIINLLESDGEFDLPKDAGLSYEEPGEIPDNDFAAALAAESMANSQHQAQPSPGQDDPFQTMAEDPMLLLDDELSLDDKPRGNGLLGKLAMALAMLASGAAGFAVWQGMDSKNQTQDLISQYETSAAQNKAAVQELRSNPLYDQKISQLEQRLDTNSGKLEAMEGRLDQQAASLKTQQGQLEQVLDQVKGANNTQALGDIQGQLSQLSQSIGSLDERLTQGQKTLDERLTQGQKSLEDRQAALGKDLDQRFERLNQSAASQVKDFSDVVVSEPPSSAPATVQETKAAPAPTPAPKAAPRVKKQMPAPTTPTNTGTKTTAGTGGPWVVNLVSTPSKKEARTINARLQRSGIHAKIKTVEIKGKTWYRLHVDGFANAAAAKSYADSVRSKPGLGQAWTGKGN